MANRANNAIRILTALILLSAGAGLWIACRAAWNSIEAEENLHATLFTVGLVDKFVADQRRWPRSWEELQGVSLPDDLAGYRWPESLPEIRRRVAVDFQADPRQIARQDPMVFAAIESIGPHYEFRDYGGVPRLQQTIRRSIIIDRGSEAREP